MDSRIVNDVLREVLSLLEENFVISYEQIGEVENLQGEINIEFIIPELISNPTFSRILRIPLKSVLGELHKKLIVKSIGGYLKFALDNTLVPNLYLAISNHRSVRYVYSIYFIENLL